MKLFLTKDVPNLGALGDVVTVKPGYARNFLIPRGMGVELARANLQWIEGQKSVLKPRKPNVWPTFSHWRNPSMVPPAH